MPGRDLVGGEEFIEFAEDMVDVHSGMEVFDATDELFGQVTESTSWRRSEAGGSRGRFSGPRRGGDSTLRCERDGGNEAWPPGADWIRLANLSGVKTRRER